MRQQDPDHLHSCLHQPLPVSKSKRIMKHKRLHILQPSSLADAGALAKNICLLQHKGFSVASSRTQCHADWPTTAGTDIHRAQNLNNALLDPNVDFVVAARGGYGASDLLPLLDWDSLARITPTPVVGFSDISALHSALFTQLGWAGLHGPMPGSLLFDADNNDVEDLLSHLAAPLPWQGRIAVSRADMPLSANSSDISGWLFGGCLAVLTSLIGTPWFPRSLDGAILFLEDTGESAARIARYWTQWEQSGATRGLRAIILGCFLDHYDTDKHSDACKQHNLSVQREVKRRSHCPVFISDEFGHISPNNPLTIGATAQLSETSLQWQLESWRR